MDETKPNIKLGLYMTRDDPGLRSSLEIGLLTGMGELKKVLGIQGATKVDIYIINGVKAYPIKAFINDEECLYPEELVRRVHSIISGRRENPGITFSSTTQSLFEQPEIGALPQVTQPWTKAVVLLVVEIIKLDPSSLFDKQSFDLYWQSFELTNRKVVLMSKDSDRLLTAFNDILALRISLSNRGIYTTINSVYEEKNESVDELSEILISALSKPEVVVLINEDYFREITNALSVTEGIDYLAMMRDGLFYELGIKYPEFRIVTSDRLSPGTFQFKINDLETLCYVGLKKDECLVNDTVDRLNSLNIKGIPAINPANGSECSIISLHFANVAEQAGLTTWNGMGYLVLCFSSELRSCGKCFVNTDLVSDYLDQLKTIWPKLVESLQDQLSLGITTKILRLLVEEQISIRNLRLILEAILERDYINTDPKKYIILDDRLPVKKIIKKELEETPDSMVGYIRSRMKEYISHKYTRGGNTLVVYLLDPEIENIIETAVVDQESVSQADYENILEAVHTEVGVLPPSAQNPVVLTINTVGPYFRSMIRNRFPQLAVLAYNELSPDMNIQPIARISLSN